jgi:predicted kinase
MPTTAIVFDLAPAVVLARNAGRRPRTVDEAVVRRHLDRLRVALDGAGTPFAGEGFAAVIVLRDPAEVDAITVRRRPTGVARLP